MDRLVHHSTIFEMNVESYRRRTAIERKQVGAGRPASYATPKNVGVPKPSDQPVQLDRGVARDNQMSGMASAVRASMIKRMVYLRRSDARQSNEESGRTTPIASRKAQGSRSCSASTRG